jgi:cyanophycinase
LKVAGSGVVTVVDGRDITFTNTSEQYAEEPLAITNVKIHVFPEGYGFNLNTKQGIIEKKVSYDDNEKSEEDKN